MYTADSMEMTPSAKPKNIFHCFKYLKTDKIPIYIFGLSIQEPTQATTFDFIIK